MASYYKKIKGVRYDRALLDAAESSVKGKGDGRISLADARRLIKMVMDGGTYTDVEQRTVKYIRNKFKFAPEADKWFRDEIKKLSTRMKDVSENPKKATPKAATVKKAARKPAKGKAPARPRKKAAAKAPPVKKAPEKPKKRVEKPKPESLIDREIARLERERMERSKAEKEVSPPRAEKESRRSFLVGAIVVIVIIIIILIFALWPKKEKPAVDVAKPTTPSEDVGKEEEKAVKEEKVIKEEAAIEEGAQYYTVKVKDDLIKISERLSGDFRDWKKIYDANRDKIKDPTLIYPGQKLLIPKEVKVKGQ
jgi:nucleoid-associated protein YgaU